MDRRSSHSIPPTDEIGASAVEYALLVSLIAAIIIASVATMGLRVFGLYSDTCTEIAGAIHGSAC